MRISMERAWWAVALLILAGGGGVAYQTLSAPAPSRGGPGNAPPGVPVVVAAAARQPVPLRIEIIGTVQTIATVSIKSRVDGYIDRVLVSDGQFVKTGDVMFQLDSRSAEAQLRQARAQLDRDRASLEGAERDLRRATDLVAKNAGPVMNLDAAKTQVGIFTGAVAADQA